MKKFISILLFLFCLSLNAQVPVAFNVRLGDSESKGLTGIELQVCKLSLSSGWRPGRYYPNKWVNSFSGALTYYYNPLKTSPYLTVGVASEGVLYNTAEYKYIGSLPLTSTGPEYKTAPSIIAIVGLRVFLHEETPTITDRISTDVGIGANISKYATFFTFEFIFNFNLLSNKSHLKKKQQDADNNNKFFMR